MLLFGFSTGALALGDFRRGLDLLRQTDATAVELSALREHELPILMKEIGDLSLSQFQYVSVHAPSRLVSLVESDVAEMLLPCLDRGWRVVLHPDAIQDAGCWRAFGSSLCIENMDKRKPTGKTADELRGFFTQLPQASLCLDLAHARQVDTTLSVARLILAEFGERIAQVHLSELDARSRHAPMSLATVLAIQQIVHWIPAVPVVLEARVEQNRIQDELWMARRCFEPPQSRQAIPARVPPQRVPAKLT